MLASMAGSFLIIALIVGAAAFGVGVPLLALKVLDWLNARRYADAVARWDFEDAEEHAGRSLY